MEPETRVYGMQKPGIHHRLVVSRNGGLMVEQGGEVYRITRQETANQLREWRQIARDRDREWFLGIEGSI